ncbi:MAG: M24 family metallopeptidase [Gammaproteobacteria bacterium]
MTTQAVAGYPEQLIGTGMLEHRDRVDFTRLRAQRRERVFAAMARLDLDAIVLGREGNVRYAAGARRLWTASARPFAPTCVLLRATGRVHLMTFSASVEGMPEEVGFEEVFCASFNPAVLAARLAMIPGLAGARRIGFDSWSFGMRDLLTSIAPGAAFVPVEPELRALRRAKLPEEIAAIRIAVALGESALAAAIARLVPGVREKRLQAAFLERMCNLGTSQYAQQGTFTAIGPNGGLRWITGDGACPAGVPVAFAAGALWAGYEGSVARTWWCGASPTPSTADRDTYRRWRRAMDAMLDACRPGNTGKDIHDAHRDAGVPLPSFPIAYSVGLGHEGPIAGLAPDPRADAGQKLEAGMVVALRAFVGAPAGGFLGEEIAVIHPDRTELLTRLGHGPLAA